MKIRNAAFNRFGTIDCEIEHPKFGWVPFTASPDDPEELGRDIHAVAIAGTVAPYIAPQPVPVIPSTVSARQFKLQLEIQGLTLSVETWVAAQSKLIRIAYANSGRFDRNEPMLQAGFAALGFSQAQLESFYTAAAAL